MNLEESLALVPDALDIALCMCVSIFLFVLAMQQSTCDTLHTVETCSASWLCSWQPGTWYGGTCSGVNCQETWRCFLTVAALTMVLTLYTVVAQLLAVVNRLQGGSDFPENRLQPSDGELNEKLVNEMASLFLLQSAGHGEADAIEAVLEEQSELADDEAVATAGTKLDAIQKAQEKRQSRKKKEKKDRERLQGSASTCEVEAPHEFSCPITFEIMVDPAFATDGHSYERVAIQAWLDTDSTSPKTGQQLESSTLIPNHSLKSLNQDWAAKQQSNT